VYIFGGFDGHGTNFDLATFDPYNRTWTNVTKTAQRGVSPPSRTNHAAASVGKNMYIFGGNNNNEEGKYQVLDDLNVLDTQTMTWSCPKTTGTAPCARSGHTLTAIGKKLYLFGGGVWNEREGWVHKFNDLYPLSSQSPNNLFSSTELDIYWILKHFTGQNQQAKGKSTLLPSLSHLRWGDSCLFLEEAASLITA
jgi:N-acetylneuraminic acid mutarotase